MKTAINMYVHKAFKNTVVTVFLLFTIYASPVQAADTVKPSPVDVIYLGDINSKPVFQIDFDNQYNEKVLLVLSDYNGNTIYSEWVKDKKYSRKIQLEDSDFETLKLKLSLRTKDSTDTFNYQINRKIHTVEDVKIIRL